MSIPFPNSLYNLSVNPGISKLVPGIYLVGDYKGTQSNQVGTTSNTDFELRYFAVDEDGQRYPEIGYAVYPTGTLPLGVNTINMSVTPTTTTYDKTVIINVFDTIAIDQSSGTAIGDKPTLTATISGGAWSSDNSDPITGITFTPIVLGSNTIVATQTDPNGDTTDSASITIDYAEDAPIVEVDGQPAIIGDISTDKYLVSGAYLYGGALAVDGNGDYVTDVNGFLVKSGGTLVEFTDYALFPSGNSVQVTGLTDDFGNTFSTTIQLVTKIPAVQYVGPTTFNEEEDGRIVTVTDGLLIDENAPYETNEDFTFNFTGDDYGSVNKSVSYSYPTGETGIIDGGVDLTYNELSFAPLDDQSQFYMINDYPTSDVLDDVEEFYMINGDL